MEGNTEAAEAAADARWARAENTLYASLVSEPHTYERVVGLVGILLDHLRADVHDRAALVAASERGTDLIGELSAESVVPWVPAEQALSAACAVRSRELSATADRQKRASTLAEASRAGLAWARIEPSVAGMGPMVAPVTWVHRPTGTAVVATTGMDPDTGALLSPSGRRGSTPTPVTSWPPCRSLPTARPQRCSIGMPTWSSSSASSNGLTAKTVSYRKCRVYGSERPMTQRQPQRSNLADLVLRLQSEGLRAPTPVEGRSGGAGPSDVGMLWVDGMALTLDATNAAGSPFELRAEDEGFGLYEHGERRAGVRPQSRPRFYDLETADGVPYWKIALLHLDSLASTVLQTCAYWGNDDQCAFCGIGVSLAAGSTIAKKQPSQLAEVAVAAAELDGVVDVTLTTGSTRAPDRGALYVARCGAAVKNASGLPVEIQFEPPESLETINEAYDLGGADTVGIHVETFDPAVLGRIAPAKARTGIEGYFAAWERAVELYGAGQVTTYVILGMGEDPDLIVEGCRRAIDLGVYPFVVPLRPVGGSLMGHWNPPEHDYVERIVGRVVPYLAERGMGASTATAGCARCQACSPMAAVEQRLDITRRGAGGTHALGA